MRQEGKVREIDQPGNKNSIIVQARGMCGKVHAYGKEKIRRKGKSISERKQHKQCGRAYGKSKMTCLVGYQTRQW